MSIVLSAQIKANSGFKIYKNKKNWKNLENLGCHRNRAENQQIFFTFVFITKYKFQKNLFFLFPSKIGMCLIFSNRDS